MKLKIGDIVKVNTGKDKGKTGKIQKIMPAKNAVIVEGLNVYKRHVKKAAGGNIIEKFFPIHYSKVNLVCPKCNQATRLSINVGDNKEKIRVCQKCKQPIS